MKMYYGSFSTSINERDYGTAPILKLFFRCTIPALVGMGFSADWGRSAAPLRQVIQTTGAGEFSLTGPAPPEGFHARFAGQVPTQQSHLPRFSIEPAPVLYWTRTTSPETCPNNPPNPSATGENASGGAQGRTPGALSHLLRQMSFRIFTVGRRWCRRN